jgi:RNA-directed DNA polymerase
MNRKFLGFTVSRNGAKLKVADKALDKLKDRVRELTRRTRGTTFAVSSQSFEKPCLVGKRTSESPRC